MLSELSGAVCLGKYPHLHVIRENHSLVAHVVSQITHSPSTHWRWHASRLLYIPCINMPIAYKYLRPSMYAATTTVCRSQDQLRTGRYHVGDTYTQNKLTACRASVMHYTPASSCTQHNVLQVPNLTHESLGYSMAWGFPINIFAEHKAGATMIVWHNYMQFVWHHTKPVE